MPILEKTSGNYERHFIKPGIKAAVLREIREIEAPSFDDPTVKVMKFVWAFELTNKKTGDTIQLEGWTNKSFNEKSTAYKWVKAILGTEPPDMLDTDDLLGAEVRINVITKTKDGKDYSVVSDVFNAAEDEDA